MPRSAAPASTYVGHVGRAHRDDPGLARTAACGRSRAPRACRCRAGRAGRACRSNSAPRGTAIRSSLTAPPVAALLAGQRDVQPLDVQREPDRRQRAAEAAEQLVVAAAAADRHAVRGVVDLEHRAGVVAEAAHEPEVEDDPLGDARRQQRVHGAHPVAASLERAREALEHLRAAADLRHAQEQLGSPSVEPERRAPRAPRRRSRRATSSARIRSRRSASTPTASSSAGYSDASPRPTR